MPPRLLGLASGLLAAAVAIAIAAMPVTAANRSIDPIITASIDPLAVAIAAEADTLPGSDGFRAALKALAEGDAAGAHALAGELPDTVERHAVQWAAIQFGSGRVPYPAIQQFETEAPAFAAPAAFQTQFEQSLTRSDASRAEIIALLGGSMPATLKGQIALAKAYLEDGQKDRATTLARAIWTENFLDPPSEKTVLAAFGDLLTREDHWARAVHLMMHDRATATGRLLEYLSPAQKTLAEARMAVSRKAKDAKKLLDGVDPSMTDHPVFIFSRAQRARQADLLESAVEWINKAEGELPDSAEWWYERRALVRQLLAEGNPELAYAAADGYRTGPDGRLVEAHFHAGWIALSFLKDAEAARAHFEEMRKHATLPDSVTQANYWLGRALMKLGNEEEATAAFAVAAGYSTIYYGQLARLELGLGPTAIREMPDWRDSELMFEANEVVRAIRLLVANGEDDIAVPLLKSFAGRLTGGPELLLAARLAESLGEHMLAISIAEDAEKQGVPLDLVSFPSGNLPKIELAGVDLAAIYAITRQESRFQQDAVSSSGALGLMQLMPGTAKETAAKMGLAYSRARLTSDPEYNTTLGSAYLARQLARYDGSLLLAAAAYNAGAGNTDKWIAAFGDPREDGIDPVVWVELIPFQETRKYVQRVLGNYLVYRARLGDDEMTMREALRRIAS